MGPAHSSVCSMTNSASNCSSSLTVVLFNNQMNVVQNGMERGGLDGEAGLGGAST